MHNSRASTTNEDNAFLLHEGAVDAMLVRNWRLPRLLRYKSVRVLVISLLQITVKIPIAVVQVRARSRVRRARSTLAIVSKRARRTLVSRK
ncbi:unnamed protein product [Sphagnum balticum]